MKSGARYLLVAGLLALLGATLAYSLLLWAGSARMGWSGMEVSVEASTTGADSASELEVEMLEPRSPAAVAGIRRGDRIVALDGSDRELLQRFRSLRAGSTARVLVRPAPPMLRSSDDQPPPAREVSFRLEGPFDRPSTLFGIIFNLLTGLTSIAIGGYVFWKRQADPRTLILFIFTFVYSLARFADAGPGHRYALFLDSRIIQFTLMVGATILLSPALLHFLLVFPKRRPVLDRFPRLLVFVYGIPVTGWLVVVGLRSLSLAFSEPRKGPFGGLQAAAVYYARELQQHQGWLAVVGFVVFGAVLLALLPRHWRDWRRHGFRRACLDAPWRTGAIVFAVPPVVSAGLAACGILTGWQGFTTAAILSLVAAGLVTGGVMFVLIVLVFPVAGLVAAVRSYHESGAEERHQLKWPLWGVVVAIPIYILTEPATSFIRWAFHVHRDSATAYALHLTARYLPTLALLLIPVSVAFAVLKYRLMDIDTYVRRTAIYGALSAILGAVYLLVVGGLGSIVTTAMSSGSEWIPIGSTLVMATLFVPVRNRVQRFVDRRFYRDTDYPAAVHKLSTRLAQKDSRSALLDALVTCVHESMHVRSASLWLLDAKRREYLAEAKAGAPDAVFDHTIAARRGWEERLAKSAPVPWDELSEAETAALKTARAAFLVPLRSANGRSGFLAIGAKLSDAPFDHSDVQFLEAVAGQTAALLEQVRSREEEQDFEKAREIQTAMLPRSIPQPPGVSIFGSWQPARFIGGDYYDVLELGQGRYAIAIADVSGKGLSAALLMSSLQAAVRVLAIDATPPAVVCDRANRVIRGNVTPGRFITFFYAVLDTRRRTLTFCNAGHNPPILRRADGEVLRLENGGPLLGFFPDPEYVEETVEVRPGDRLLLFTDGLSEAANGDDEEFGEDRLVDLLAHPGEAQAESLCAVLLDAVSRHCNARFEDDVTMLVVALEMAAALEPEACTVTAGSA